MVQELKFPRNLEAKYHLAHRRRVLGALVAVAGGNIRILWLTIFEWLCGCRSKLECFCGFMVTNSNDCFEVFCVKLCEIASNECPSVSNECQISVKACQISAKSVPKRGKGVSKEYFISLKPRKSARTQKKPGRSSETPKKEGRADRSDGVPETER